MACTVSFKVGPKGAAQAAEAHDLCIVVDLLRASSTIITALYKGIRSVKAVADLSKCTGKATAGEIRGEKIPGLTYGNSPTELLKSSEIHKSLTLFTTNGTKCIDSSSEGASKLLIGSLINKTAVANIAYHFSQKLRKGISIILAGYHGKLEEDDLLAGSAIYSLIPHAKLKGDIKPRLLKKQDSIKSLLKNSPAGKRLIEINQEEDILFCSQEDFTEIVPVYEKRDGQFIKFSSTML